MPWNKETQPESIIWASIYQTMHEAVVSLGYLQSDALVSNYIPCHIYIHCFCQFPVGKKSWKDFPGHDIKLHLILRFCCVLVNERL